MTTEPAGAAGPRRYRTILADPPWGTPNNLGGRGVDRHYRLLQSLGLRRTAPAADILH